MIEWEIFKKHRIVHQSERLMSQVTDFRFQKYLIHFSVLNLTVLILIYFD